MLSRRPTDLAHAVRVDAGNCLARTLCVALCAALLPSLACDVHGVDRELLGLVPAGSRVAVRLAWPEVCGNPDLQEALGPRSVVDAIVAFGVDNSAVTEAVQLAGLTASGEAYGVVLLRGNLSVGQVMRRLSQSGWTSSRSGGVRCLTEPGGTRSAVALGRSIIGLGDSLGVRKTVRVYREQDSSLLSRSPYGSIVAQLDERRSVAQVLIPIPESVTDAGTAAIGAASLALDIAGLGSVGSMLSGVGSAHGLGYGIRPTGSGFAVTLALAMQSEQAAGSISGSIGLLKGLAALTASFGGPEQAAQLAEVDRMTVNRVGSVVYFDLPMTREELLR